MKHVGSNLPKILKLDMDLIHDAIAIENEDAKSAGTIGYMARVLTQCTIPHRNVEEEIYRRSNGNLTISIADINKAGIPYGTIPRLLLAWLTTEAVIKKERKIILGDSLNQFMRQLELVPTGGRWGTITRLKDQMNRLFGCAIGIKVETEQSLHVYHPQIAKEVHLWWDPKQPEQAAIWDSHVVLNHDFFEEIINNPVPIDMRAIAALKRSPMALDIYMWLTYRMSYLSRRTEITWEQLQFQMGAGYSFDEHGRENFQRAFTKHLRSVLTVYKDARVSQERGRLVLHPSSTHIPKIR